MAVMILLGVLLVSSQVLADCAVKPTTQNFDVSKFMGTWYFIKEATTMWHSDTSKYKCNQLEFTLQPNGDIQSDFTICNKSDNAYKTFTRTIRKEDPNSSEGRLRVYREGFSGVGTMYNVLETDYDNYALIWMCRETDDPSKPKEMPYALSRTRTGSDELREKARTTLPDSVTYADSIQSDCPARN